MSKKKKVFAPVANVELYNAMVLLRRSGAAGVHLDKRSRRARTRSAATNKAIKDYM